jgi:uncharacterized protein (TIRG00374 family)
MGKWASGLLKLALSAAIIGYLVWEATTLGGHASAFAELMEKPKHWSLLALAFGVFVVSIVLTLVRWWWLNQALGVPGRLQEVMRIGFWGLLFNLAPLGVVSGDLVKAALLGRKHPDQRVRVFAAVLVDRIVGVYLLFLFVSVAIVVTGFRNFPGAEVATLCNGVFLAALGGALGIMLVMVPGVTGGWGLRTLARIPRVGRTLENLIQALRLYRHRLGALAGAAGLTLVIHALSALSCYLIARGLGETTLPLADQFVVVPISIAASVLPLPLGPFEFVLEFLYTQLPLGVGVPKGQGLIVALVYRLMAIVTAAGGVALSLGERRAVAQARRDVGVEAVR